MGPERHDTSLIGFIPLEHARIPLATTREPGIKDVAARADVSVGTVSNFLNHPERVSDAMAARVRAAIDETGYVRNESARQLRTGSSRTIGLVVLDVTNPFFADVTLGVEEVARQRGSLVVVANSADDPAQEGRQLDAMLEQRVQGLLITPIGAPLPILERFTKLGIPVVIVDRVPPGPTHCCVAVDDVEGGLLAGRHLLESPRRELTFIGGPPELPQVRHRLQGMRQAVQEAGGNPDDIEVQHEASLTLETGAAALRALLTQGRLGDGLFAANDLMALGALRILQDNGIRVPDDVALVGYDDITFARAAAVPLTSVRQPRAALGRTAARMLFEELDDGDDHVHRSVVFDPELVVRASTLSGTDVEPADVPGPGVPRGRGRRRQSA